MNSHNELVGGMAPRRHRQASIPVSAWNESLTVSYEDVQRNTDKLHPSTAATPSRQRGNSASSGTISLVTRVDRGYEAAGRLYQKRAGAYTERSSTDDSILSGIGGRFPSPITDKTIKSSLVKYAGQKNGKSFLPVDKLFELFNENTVRQTLMEALKHVEILDFEVVDYAARICGRIGAKYHKGRPLSPSASRMMFATLIMVEKVGDIRAFIDAGFTDEDLHLVSLEDDTERRLFPRRIPKDQRHQWKIGLDWDNNAWVSFKEHQSWFGSPFFDINNRSNKVPHHDLAPSEVLPFIEEYRLSQSIQGGFSLVRKIRIHPKHHNLHNGNSESNPFFAVKELLQDYDQQHSSSEISFRDEVRGWAKSVGTSKHPHLINLLATWRQNDTWYLLFPWAKSSLRDYWRYCEPDRNPETLCWIIRQCLGLAEGLKKIHRSKSDEFATDWGIHGDIKPENVLLFDHSQDPLGILVICDFGFTRFHGRDSRSNATPVGKSPTYRAPEYDSQAKISRAYDMWTLGCLYLEFVTWYLTGSEGVTKTFVDMRLKDDRGEFPGFNLDKFFNFQATDKTKVESKDSVRDWVQHLRHLPDCSDCIRDFLDTINRLMRIDVKSRIDCGKLVIELMQILEKTKASQYLVGSSYAQDAIPSSGATSFTFRSRTDEDSPALQDLGGARTDPSTENASVHTRVASSANLSCLDNESQRMSANITESGPYEPASIAERPLLQQRETCNIDQNLTDAENTRLPIGNDDVCQPEGASPANGQRRDSQNDLQNGKIKRSWLNRLKSFFLWVYDRMIIWGRRH